MSESSGNVFGDLGLSAPDIRLAKAELAASISAVIKRRKLTQAQAASLLGVDQPKVSALMRGRLGGFSTDRLLRFLLAMGQDIRIIVRVTRRRKGHGKLVVEEKTAS